MACLVVAGCATPAPSKLSHAAAIRAVLEEDAELGAVRNHASESMPLASAVAAYVRSLDAIDFRKCPADFTAAFERHRDAWQESVRHFEEYEEMRGELHDVFEQIRGVSEDARKRIETIENALHGTWAEVEAAVDRHGAGSG